MNTDMPDAPPSIFVKMGQPNCSRWGKSEMEWLALAYVEALAADGDTWKQISKERTYELLTEKQRCFVHCMLTDDFYDGWFQTIRDRITDSAGAWSVGGFWNRWRYDQVTAATSEVRQEPK
jgi:hypothetical protein